MREREKQFERLRVKEEQKKRRSKELEMKRIKENSRKQKEKILMLTVKNESLTCNNNLLNQKIKELKRITILKNELLQKEKYYRDKYLDVSKMIEALRKKVKQTENSKKETSVQREVNTGLDCSVCEENLNIKESIKEKFESMNDQYKIIQKFRKKRTTKKKYRKVNNIYFL